MPFGIARPKTCRLAAPRVGYSCGVALLIVLFGCRGLQTAVADGDTRTISMHHVHTNEDITITYKRAGRYDEAALEKLNWFLRDWRRGKDIRIDPQLIDLLWEVQRETGSKQPIYVVCGYRSPQTNAMLRRRSRGVARLSQHMLGHAVDFYVPGVPLMELRVIGLRMQRGGVGFYPTSGSPFVHMDTGGVRMWPRMTRDQLLHVFPDGRTVYIPSDGNPLPGYDVALAALRKRGQNPTATWIEEARAQGVDKSIVLASDGRRRAEPAGETAAARDADREDDEREAAADASSAAAAPVAAANPLLIALEREAQRRRAQVQVAAADVPDNAPAVYQAAFYTSPSDAAAASSPDQNIVDGVDWQTGSDASAPRDAAVPGARRRGQVQVASAADATGAIPAFPRGLEDRVPPALMLAYSAQANTATANTAAESAPRISQAQTGASQPPPETTIAVKRSADQMVSTIITARSHRTAATRVDDPWLDAMMISPSVRHFLTAMMLGDRNYTTLTSLIEKPTRSLVMTFGADPNPGMTYDHFSGSAIAFLPSVNYAAPTDTASLH